MKTIRPLSVHFAAAISLLVAVPLTAGDQITLEVRETAGIRRFGYPIAAELKLDPPAPAATRFRLLNEGKPVVSQFRPIKHAGDKIAAVALDFDSNFMPLESREYVVEFGPDVTPIPEPTGGMKVVQTEDAFLVSHGPNLTWTVPKDLAGLLRSVKTPKTDYLRTDSAGLFIRTRDDALIRIGAPGQNNPPMKTRIIKHGPIDCVLRFDCDLALQEDRSVASVVELEFPRSKSWIRVTWTIDDPNGLVTGLGAELNLNVTGEPTLVDFGAGSLVYATLTKGQIARLQAGLPLKGKARRRELTEQELRQLANAERDRSETLSKSMARPMWETFRGSPEKLEPYVTGPPVGELGGGGLGGGLRNIAAGWPEGWAHVMDRERCTAVAVANFARETLDRIDVGADGRLQVSREIAPDGFDAAPGPKPLTFWLHFVGMPPHVGAVTSPQSMQAPLDVKVKAKSGERGAESQESDGDAAAPIDAKSRDDVEALKLRCRAALAKTSGELRLDGLKDKVEVLRDKWGIPHIYAQNRDDLFFAQGFVQAQDRLWQLEIWRRTTEGRLAEIVGPEAVERDRFARLIRYRGDMDAEWTSYSPDARPIIESFVRGVNAFIELCRDNPPIEFQLTGIKPEPWTPDVCLGRMAGFIMCRNATNEVLRAQLAREVGPELAAKLLPIDPYHDLQIPDGLDLDGIDHRILAGINTTSAAIRVPLRDDTKLSATSSTNDDGFHSAFRTPHSEISDEGSNNWTIAGRLTTTGKPILASDPHRPVVLPSLRYFVHLNAPPHGDERGWDVIGGTEPALPGVALGHNGRVAWGMTIVGSDQMDIYVEETRPGEPNSYRVGNGWQPMRVEREQIRVRGEPESRRAGIELKFTRHGPVIFEDLERRRAYALRWTGSEPGSAGYLAALAVDRVRNWKEFAAASARWKVPGLNLVYADVDGHIGWIAAALTPVRRGWDGLLPVPGAAGKFEWDGFLPVTELPQRFDPPEGYIATANHNILPPGYRRQISYEWAAPFRFGRIDEVLRQQIAASRKFSIEDSERLQHDATSIPARRLLNLLRGVVDGKTYRGPAIDERLLRWDGVLARDSAASAIFEVWQRLLAERVLKSRVPEKLWERYSGRLPLQVVLELLEQPDSSFGPEPVSARRDTLLIDALTDAIRELTKQLGDDSTKWNWGALHQAHLKHMLATTQGTERGERRAEGQKEEVESRRLLSPGEPGSRADSQKEVTTERGAIASVFNLSPVPRDGDGNTPLATGGPKFEQATGASYRHIIDLADFDRSVATSAPGQSGQPGSPHYDDLLPLWAKGEYFPLLYTRDAVEAATTNRLTLVPVR